MRKYAFGGPLINLAFQRAKTGGGRILRDRLYGFSGEKECLAHGHYSGVQIAQPVTLSAGGNERQAILDAIRTEWNTAGTTITLRVFRRTGPNPEDRVLVTEGTVESGPATFKGATVDPALPLIASPAFADGDFQLEAETSGGLRYALQIAE